MAKAKIWGNWSPENEKGSIAIFCPGCNEHHIVPTIKPLDNGALWAFNGNFESPTITPSISIKTGKYVPGHEDFDDQGYKLSSICHSVVTDGKIFFCADSTHHLSGQTVDLPEIKEDKVSE